MQLRDIIKQAIVDAVRARIDEMVDSELKSIHQISKSEDTKSLDLDKLVETVTVNELDSYDAESKLPPKHRTENYQFGIRVGQRWIGRSADCFERVIEVIGVNEDKVISRVVKEASGRSKFANREMLCRSLVRRYRLLKKSEIPNLFRRSLKILKSNHKHIFIRPGQRWTGKDHSRVAGRVIEVRAVKFGKVIPNVLISSHDAKRVSTKPMSVQHFRKNYVLSQTDTSKESKGSGRLSSST